MTAKELVNSLLDHIRQDCGFTSDEQLAAYLNVSDTQIWRWRDGQLGKMGRILFPKLYEYHDMLTTASVETAA